MLFRSAPAVAQAAQKLVTGAEAAQEALGTAATVTNPLTVPTMAAQKAVDIKRAAIPNKLLQQEEINAVRDATLRAAQQEGFMVTPGSVSPTGKHILAERVAGKTHLEQLMSVNNQAQADRLARRAVGISETAPLTTEGMEAIRKEIGRAHV